MTNHTVHVFEAHLLSDADWVAARDLCRLCQIDLEALREIAELGLVDLRGNSPDEWQLPATSLPRLRTVGRLMRDLGVNLSGAALAVELLERIRELERLRR